MKSSFAGLAIMTLAAATGCFPGTPGGAGMTGGTVANSGCGGNDDTFHLSVLLASSTLQQGEQRKGAIGINRDENFGDDITIQFADVPQGVTIEPSNPVIKRGDRDTKITFKARDDAPRGDFHVQITGHGPKAGDSLLGLTLTIVAKDQAALPEANILR